MSEENVEVVRKAVNAANAFMRGELSGEAFAEIGVVDPQLKFSWHDERTMPDLPQHLDSAPEGIKLLEQLRSAWADLPWEALEYIEAPGDRIVTLLRQSFRGRERPPDGCPLLSPLDDPRWKGGQDRNLPPSGGRPRSRWAVGIAALDEKQHPSERYCVRDVAGV
jgi:hypothetical protein